MKDGRWHCTGRNSYWGAAAHRSSRSLACGPQSGEALRVFRKVASMSFRTVALATCEESQTRKDCHLVDLVLFKGMLYVYEILRQHEVLPQDDMATEDGTDSQVFTGYLLDMFGGFGSCDKEAIAEQKNVVLCATGIACGLILS